MSLKISDPVAYYHSGNAKAAGKRHNVDPAVILAILSVEGGTDAQGHPVAPADGLGPASFGQFITATGQHLGVKYGDSASETDALARYLNELGYQKDPTRAIAAYNGGPARPNYSYASKVQKAITRYRGASGGDTGATSGGSSSSTSTTSSGLLDAGERSGAVRALLWTALTAGGVLLAGLGVTRTLGVGRS